MPSQVRTKDFVSVLDFEAATGLNEPGGGTVDLVVRGTNQDTVTLDSDAESPWVQSGSQVFGGQYGGATYDLYTNGTEWIAVEEAIAVELT